ncbi:hypothetical protein JFU37_30465 [Pseudomonas sp. TH41]|uniref:hypothetical protein n=1 Tax=Pseudomonas sp. TH41 TaxID=2796405 RepID=UPI0019113D4C|nr:hypothetical protein [Pseudomonas sp. TH41]MBK5356774.1 hypothetical protein [Pseudomonas sp. TH41]
MFQQGEKPAGSQIELSALLIAALTGLLYLSGDAAHRGYLGYFGLANELFPLSVAETLSRGLEPFTLDYLIPASFYLIIVASALFTATVFLAPNILRRLSGKISRLSKPLLPKKPDHQQSRTKVKWIALGKSLLIIVVIFVFGYCY